MGHGRRTKLFLRHITANITYHCQPLWLKPCWLKVRHKPVSPTRAPCHGRMVTLGRPSLAASSAVTFASSLQPHCRQNVAHALLICGGATPAYFTPGFAPLGLAWGWLLVGLLLGALASKAVERFATRAWQLPAPPVAQAGDAAQRARAQGSLRSFCAALLWAASKSWPRQPSPQSCCLQGYWTRC